MNMRNPDITETIRNAILEYYEEYEKFPTISRLSEVTGHHRTTVREHMERMNLTSEMLPLFRTRTPNILAGLARKAEDGDAPAAKLWLQFVENWKETSVKEKKNVEMTPELWEIIEKAKGIV